MVKSGLEIVSMRKVVSFLNLIVFELVKLGALVGAVAMMALGTEPNGRQSLGVMDDII